MPDKTAEASVDVPLSLCRSGFAARPLMKMAGSTPVTLGAFACTSDTSETNRLHIDQNKMVWKDVKHCSAHRVDIQSMFEREMNGRI